MKATIYIFGNFADGYSQYPDDYTRTLFESISKSRKSATELVYHREGSLTYYIYTREISRTSNTFIGLCYVFNDILVTDFSFLFDVFEDTITNIVVKGELLEFTNDGNLSSKVNQLYSNTEELQRVSDFLNSKISSLGKYAEKLPPANFAISNTEWKLFAFDEIPEAQKAIKDYANIRVLKGENYDTNSLKGYAHKLKTLNNELTKQKEEIDKLNRQKKQIKWVVFLLILIIIGGIGFYFYAQDKIAIIQNKSETIVSLHDEIQHKDQYIESLKSDSTILSNQYKEIKHKLSKVHNILQNNVSSYLYFNSWRSTNYRQPNSTSQITYSFYAYANDELYIPYFVSSENEYDYLKIQLQQNGYSTKQLLKLSGVESGALSYTFSTNDSYQLIISYSKDDSNDHNNDRAGVNQFYIYRPLVNKLQELSEY